MSFTVNLLRTPDDPETVNKTYTTIATVTAVPTEGCSMLHPKLILDATVNLTGVNYMYIPYFSRYYYVGDPVLLTGKKIMIPGSVDYLMSNATALQSCEVSVIRSESVGSPTMIPDSKLPIDPNKKELLTAVKTFHPSGSNCYLVRVKESVIKYVQPSREVRRDADQ